MRSALVVALSTLVLGGCDEETLDSSRRLGDTTFVFSSSPRRGAASLREISRLGMMDGPPEYLLGMFPMFTVGPGGDLFVADGELRQYDTDGRYVRTIARRGAGPGEVRAVAGMDISADGLLAVLDFGNRRVSVFSYDGNLVREIRYPSLGRPGYGRDVIRWDAQGQLWIALNPPRTGPDTLEVRQRPLFGRLIDHEEVGDTVFLPTRAWEGCERRLPVYAGGFFEDTRIPHMPFAHWTRSRTGTLAFGCSASYVIDIAEPEEGVTRVSRAWDPPMRTSEETEYYSEVFRRPIPRPPGTELARPPPIPNFPRERPAFLRLWFSEEGRMWVWRGAVGWSRATTEEERQQSPSLPRVIWEYWHATDGFDVFDANGRWLGHVNTPETWDADPYPGIIDPYFKGDTLWAVVKEELDVRYIVRFEVEWPSPG